MKTLHSFLLAAIFTVLEALTFNHNNILYLISIFIVLFYSFKHLEPCRQTK